VFQLRGGPGGTIPLPGYDTPRTVSPLGQPIFSQRRRESLRTRPTERASRAVLIAVIATIVLAGLVILARELGSTPAPEPATRAPRSAPPLPAAR
jgi:hypothetical protein